MQGSRLLGIVFLIPTMLVVTGGVARAGDHGPAASTVCTNMRGRDLVSLLHKGRPFDCHNVTFRGRVDLRHVGIIPGPIRCLNCIFKGRFKASDVVFERIVVLSGATFKGTVDLRGAEFKEGLFVRVARNRTTFYCRTWLSLATFSGPVDFSRTTFDQLLDSNGARFLDNATFADVRFRGPADFSHSNFSEGVDFSVSAPAGQAGQAGPPGRATCGSALDGGLDEEVSFRNARFDHAANFRGRSFGGDADFVSSAFLGRADFTLAHFHGAATFDSAGFQSASFLDARFDARSSFLTADATGSLQFDSSMFGGDSNFRRLTVGDTLSFEGADFRKPPIVSDLSAGDLVMGIGSARSVVAPKQTPGANRAAREDVLKMIQDGATARDDLVAANEARFQLRVLQNHDLTGIGRVWDALVYRDVAGYLVKPLNPLIALGSVVGVGALIRALLRLYALYKGPAGQKSRAAPRHLRVTKAINAVVGGIGDALVTVFRPKPDITIKSPDLSRWYLLAAAKWAEYLLGKVLLAVCLLALASANPTLRDLIDTVRKAA